MNFQTTYDETDRTVTVNGRPAAALISRKDARARPRHAGHRSQVSGLLDRQASTRSRKPSTASHSFPESRPDAESGYWCTPLSAEEKARGEVNFAPFVAQMLVASGRFRVSADTPDQVELFQGVARRVSDVLQRPVVSYANGREIVITFGQGEPRPWR
jgi:hypothetical protein